MPLHNTPISTKVMQNTNCVHDMWLMASQPRSPGVTLSHRGVRYSDLHVWAAPRRGWRSWTQHKKRWLRLDILMDIWCISRIHVWYNMNTWIFHVYINIPYIYIHTDTYRYAKCIDLYIERRPKDRPSVQVSKCPSCRWDDITEDPKDFTDARRTWVKLGWLQ